ncbi:hypothetical protein JCM15765_00130 [Paradesulfitobacterium aromaticivorans]
MHKPEDLFDEAVKLGSKKTLAHAKNELNKHDRRTLEDTEKAQKGKNGKPKHRVEIWDKVSPVNGIPADVLAKDVPEGGEVYILYLDGKAVQIQKQDPELAGNVAMDKATALAKGGKMIDEHVGRIVDEEVREKVLRALLS